MQRIANILERRIDEAKLIDFKIFIEIQEVVDKVYNGN